MAEFRLETERLTLREWRQDDVEPFLAIGRDREVMRYLGPPLDREQAEASVLRRLGAQHRHGHCFWAVERRDDRALIGFCGLERGHLPTQGTVEIGWRLARDAWGRGYAVEAARASLDWGWTMLAETSIAAITVAANRRSWGLMERLGMTRRPREDFDHPALAPSDPLRAHIVYRIDRPPAPTRQAGGSSAWTSAAAVASRSVSVAARSRNASSVG